LFHSGRDADFVFFLRFRMNSPAVHIFFIRLQEPPIVPVIYTAKRFNIKRLWFHVGLFASCWQPVDALNAFSSCPRSGIGVLWCPHAAASFFKAYPYERDNDLDQGLRSDHADHQ
jgi:hypothetical protein